MKNVNDIIDLSVVDKSAKFFEGQYYVDGMIYRSSLLAGTVVFDTVDAKCVDKWLKKLDSELGGIAPTYLIVSHVEPDHSSGIIEFVRRYPTATIVATAMAFEFIARFYAITPMNKMIVKDGDSLQISGHTLKFFTAPMVHWPEVLMTFDESTGVLFSADAFGSFGTETKDNWIDEARRYYINIVGKYGAQVQNVLKKLPKDIKTIYPLHGRVLSGDLSEYIHLYDEWSSYSAEERGVLVVYSTIYGNTENAARTVFDALSAANVNAKIMRLSDADEADIVANAFKYDRLVLCSTTYDGGLFPLAERFLARLKCKNYRSRSVAIVENGSWAPMAGKRMREEFAQMQDVKVIASVTLLSSTNGKTKELRDLAKLIAQA